MGRPYDPDTPYRVTVHVNNGYRYASTQPTFKDPKTGKTTHRYIHWGTLDENNRFIPGKRYILASVEERKKLIFPADWDLSEADRLAGRRPAGRPLQDSQDENRLYGDIWLLEQIAEVTGVRKDLVRTFD